MSLIGKRATDSKRSSIAALEEKGAFCVPTEIPLLSISLSCSFTHSLAH